MNARRQTDNKINPLTNESILVRKSRLKNNERFSSLVKVLGLDYTKKYTKYDILVILF